MQLPVTPSSQLDGKRALMVGASSGLGLGCAVALAEAGADIVLAARDAPKLEEAAAAIRRRGLSASVLALDVANIERTENPILQNGPFDAFVNSAGLARHSAAADTTHSDFDEVFAVNVRGAYFATRAVAKGLIAAGKPGSLINISSQMGHVGGVERAVYCATRHAVEGFSKSMAIEWGPHGIRVNTICPTFIRTPLTEATFAEPERAKWIRDKIKLGRVGRVEDIMVAVAYLASDASSMVTGTALMIDGGWTAD